VHDHLQSAAEWIVDACQQVPLRVWKAAGIAAGVVVFYLSVAALISHNAFPVSGPPPSDVPHPGMMLVDRGIKTTVVLRRTASETDGAFVEMDTVIEPDGGAGTLGSHVHPDVEERITVLEGTMVLDVEGDERIVTAGQTAVIPRDVAHGIRNTSDRELVLRGRFEPAGDLDGYYVQVDRAGGFSGAGSVRLAVLSMYFRQQYPGWLPVWLSKLSAQVVVPSARLVGVPAYYPPIS